MTVDSIHRFSPKRRIVARPNRDRVAVTAFGQWHDVGAESAESADWLLTETLTLMDGLTDKRIHRFVKTVRNHQPRLLTFLKWVAADLPDWRQRLSVFLLDPTEADAFQRTAARHWRLQQMLINGHRHWRTLADETALELDLWFLSSFGGLRLRIDADPGRCRSYEQHQ